MSAGDFERSVFVNCPFSPDYREKQWAIVFLLIRLGLRPCIASQESDSGDVRIEKIKRFIRECRHGIHDLSLNVATIAGEPARMNMPYELGLDLGARWFGAPPLGTKKTLVLEKTRGSVKTALTDLDFGDHRAHEGSIEIMIRELRAHFYSFLYNEQGTVPIDFPTHDALWGDWVQFVAWLQQHPNGTLRPATELDQMEIPEFKSKASEWLAANYPGRIGQPFGTFKFTSRPPSSLARTHRPGDDSSPARSLIEEHVKEVYDRFLQDAVTPWAFFRTGKGVAIDLPNGQKIRYAGIEFDGSARLVYWSVFPETFIKEIVKSTFEWTRDLCDKRNLDPVLPLKETAMFLEGGLDLCLDRMADIDRKLRGKGRPKSVPPYQPDHEREALSKIISKRLKAELRLAGGRD